MAKYNEEARIFANLVKDKNNLKAQIAGASDVIQIIKGARTNLKVELYNLEIKTRVRDDGFVLGHPTLGILGTAELGVGVVNDQVLHEKRKWIFNTQSELEEGAASVNIDLTAGDIRLAT